MAILGLLTLTATTRRLFHLGAAECGLACPSGQKLRSAELEHSRNKIRTQPVVLGDPKSAGPSPAAPTNDRSTVHTTVPIMMSAIFLTAMVFAGLLLFAILALIATAFRVAFSIAWIPLKIVGVLLATVLFLVVGLPLLVVALPVGIVLFVVAIPFLILGAVFCGGMTLFGFA